MNRALAFGSCFQLDPRRKSATFHNFYALNLPFPVNKDKMRSSRVRFRSYGLWYPDGEGESMRKIWWISSEPCDPFREKVGKINLIRFCESLRGIAFGSDKNLYFMISNIRMRTRFWKIVFFVFFLKVFNLIPFIIVKIKQVKPSIREDHFFLFLSFLPCHKPRPTTNKNCQPVQEKLGNEWRQRTNALITWTSRIRLLEPWERLTAVETTLGSFQIPPLSRTSWIMASPPLSPSPAIDDILHPNHPKGRASDNLF